MHRHGAAAPPPPIQVRLSASRAPARGEEESSSDQLWQTKSPFGWGTSFWDGGLRASSRLASLGLKSVRAETENTGGDADGHGHGEGDGDAREAAVAVHSCHPVSGTSRSSRIEAVRPAASFANMVGRPSSDTSATRCGPYPAWCAFQSMSEHPPTPGIGRPAWLASTNIWKREHHRDVQASLLAELRLFHHREDP